MSNEDKEKLALICAAAKGVYTTGQVARQLGVNERTVRNLKKRYMEQGKKALVHGNSGKQPANYIEEDLRMRIIDLRKSAAYSEGKVTHFRKVLDEREGINISYTALLNILKAAGIAADMKIRDKTGAFMFKGAFGEMLGLAAHSHDWFGDGTPCVLYGLADDATRRITGLYFHRNECAKGYIEVLRQTLRNYGIPCELYAENARIVSCGTSWLGSVVQKLGTDIMNDSSAPYAKKHVERLCKALRKHLPRWLEKQGISDMEQANLELCHFIDNFNGHFANEPREPDSSFVQLGGEDLDKLLAFRQKADTDSQGRFFFKGFAFTVDSEKPLANRKIEFVFSEATGFLAYCGGEYHKAVSIACPSLVLKSLIEESNYANLSN